MRMFTRLTCLCLCIVIAASMVSCTTGQGGHTSAGLSISLTSDKDAIFADGADAVTFTVIDNSSREDVTSASVSYGRHRAGETCSGGICRYVPEYTGMNARLSIIL